MRYLVTLKPVEPFFFGGDRNFGSSYGKNEANFYVKSQKFPLQTQVIGMVRKLLLEQNKLLQWHSYKNNNALYFTKWVGKGHKKARDLVGAGKVTIDSLLDESELNLGKIEKISPLFFTKNNLYYQYAPKVDNSFLNIEENHNMKLSINGESFDFGYKLTKDDGSNWIAKDRFEERLIGVNKKSIVEKQENKDIFVEYITIGNRKNHPTKHRFSDFTKEEKEEAMFKKLSYSLEENFKFAFILDIDSSLDFKDEIVQLGGENSKFLLNTNEFELSYEELFKSIFEIDGYTVLASDCYIKDDLDKKLSIMIADETKSFRTLDKRHKSNKWKFTRKSQSTIYLLPKGTILKTKNGCSFNIANKNLQKIGYNIAINKEQKWEHTSTNHT